MSQEYYYAKNGQQLGPVSADELRELLQSKQVSGTDLVWTEGMSDWKPAKEVTELKSVASPPPPKPTATTPSPLAQNSTSDPFSETPAARSSGVSDKAGPAMQALRDKSRKALSGIRTIARATGMHVAQLFSVVSTRAKIRTAQREALRTRAELGQKMHSVGTGDEQARKLIDEIETRIRNAKAAGMKAGHLQQELCAAHAALAEPFLDGDMPPPGTNSEFEAAQAAKTALLGSQTAAAGAHSSLKGMHAQNGWQIGVGYLTLFLVASSIVWASLGSGKASPSKGVVKKQGPNEGGGGGEAPVDNDGGGGNAPIQNPPEELIVQQPVSGNQPTTCNNCYGTGQADCTACFGTGKRTCFNCNGSGRAVNGMQCFQCNGTGKQNCSFCTYGKVQCPHCFGRGTK